jgi:hypothetical protein
MRLKIRRHGSVLLGCSIPFLGYWPLSRLAIFRSCHLISQSSLDWIRHHCSGHVVESCKKQAKATTYLIPWNSHLLCSWSFKFLLTRVPGRAVKIASSAAPVCHCRIMLSMRLSSFSVPSSVLFYLLLSAWFTAVPATAQIPEFLSFQYLRFTECSNLLQTCQPTLTRLWPLSFSLPVASPRAFRADHQS